MPDSPVTLHHGNCMTVLPTIPTASVDSIVTDPPYELGFMGKQWDASGIAYNVELWRECLRVLKPGGHLLAFGGTRTYHRMAVAIEDAGFEIRDSIHWLYGSGFPKSLDVSKAIDKRGGSVAGFKEFRDAVRAAMKKAGVSRQALEVALGNYMLSHYLTAGSQPAIPNYRDYIIIRDAVGLGDGFDHLFSDEAEREVVGSKTTGDPVSWYAEKSRGDGIVPITAPATDAARTWAGWGTALKPAHEPIVVARKPVVGTVAANVLEYGTGALNIDGCRVATDDALPSAGGDAVMTNEIYGKGLGVGSGRSAELGGRWPANIVLTHAPECDDVCVPGCPVAELDAQSGTLKSGNRSAGDYGRLGYEGWDVGPMPAIVGDSGGASRFFTVTEWDEVPFRYVAKPAKRERNAGGENHHPTVKPLALMRWLVRLVTPPGGIVLDPFAGSGTTLAAAILEGFDPLGIELTEEYLPIIQGRVAWATEQAVQLTLFGDKGEAA